MVGFADALIDARRTDILLADATKCQARTLADAFAIQADVAAKLDAKIAGWKVGFGPDRAPFADPIFAEDIRSNGANWPLGPHPLKIEVELAIRFGRDVPTPRAGDPPVTREALLDSITQVYTGIELVRSRFVDAEAMPFLARVADNFGNLGFVESAGITAFRNLRMEKLRVRAWIDDDLRQEGVGTHQEGDPLNPVLAWIAVAGDHLGGLRAGQFITTGTLIDPIDVASPAFALGELEGLGQASVRLV